MKKKKSKTKLEEQATILLAKVAGAIVEQLKPEATPNWSYMRNEFLAALQIAWGEGRIYGQNRIDDRKDVL